MNPSDWTWLWIPFVASALLCVALIPVGDHILKRGAVFSDIAIAQWTALGSLIAGVVTITDEIEKLFEPYSLYALVFALIASFLVHLLTTKFSQYREAFTGLLYVLGASLAVMVVSHDPHGKQALANTLNGDLLWVGRGELIALGVSALMTCIWYRLASVYKNRLFVPLLALVVGASVQSVGIYVVFATLVCAPLMLCRIRGRGVFMAACVTASAYGVAILVSVSFDCLLAPMIVLSIILLSTIMSYFLGISVFRSKVRLRC